MQYIRSETALSGLLRVLSDIIVVNVPTLKKLDWCGAVVALSLSMQEVVGLFPGLAIRVDSEDH